MKTVTSHTITPSKSTPQSGAPSTVVTFNKEVLIRHLLLLAILILSPNLAAQQYSQPHHEQTFFQASELRSWCESEARNSFAVKNIATYQWTARYFEDGNLLVVEGSIRVHGDDIPVICRVVKGARERDVVVEIVDK